MSALDPDWPAASVEVRVRRAPARPARVVQWGLAHAGTPGVRAVADCTDVLLCVLAFAGVPRPGDFRLDTQGGAHPRWPALRLRVRVRGPQMDDGVCHPSRTAGLACFRVPGFGRVEWGRYRRWPVEHRPLPLPVPGYWCNPWRRRPVAPRACVVESIDTGDLSVTATLEFTTRVLAASRELARGPAALLAWAVRDGVRPDPCGAVGWVPLARPLPDDPRVDDAGMHEADLAPAKRPRR